MSVSTSASPRATSRGLLLMATLLALLAPVLTAIPASAAAPVAAPVLDGSSQSTAAASCWEIKQNTPAATDGTYWLLTPQLVYPRRFFCDMTTDGGGWVLIGRGRDGWKENYNGLGTSDELAATVSGTAAFPVRQLDSRVVDALLGGQRIDSMTDGVRLKRARSIDGTQTQETRFTFKSRDRWSWAFGGGHPIASGTVGTAAVANTSTRDFGVDDGWQRVWTFDDPVNQYVRGFSYGYDVSGSTAADSYLYSKAEGNRYPTPFTQVFVRPKLRTADLTYPTIAASGTPAVTQKAIPQSGSVPTTWGVTGTGAAGTGENSSEVQAFAQIGNVMYVGGNFTTVQKGAGATGADKVAQPYLAAFDATTGAYLSAFQPPVLDNQVKSLAALPGGRLAVGGEFTTVGGANRPGLVVLDGSTGAVDTAWGASILNKVSGGVVSIRGLDVSGDYLYVGGAMSHLKVGTGEVYAKGAGRIKISTRVPDSGWNPEFNGTVTGLDASDDGARVYFSGYFTQAGSVEALRGAAFSTAAGAPRATPTWTPTASTAGSARYQQAVKQIGSRVWLGGSQHNFFGYDTGTFALNKKHVTKWGGDIQAIESGNGLAFAGCHCENWNYSDTSDFDGTSPGQSTVSWSQLDKIYYIGAYDAGTGDYVPDFTPEMRARNGYGVWAIKTASDGTVWAGGSLQNGVSSSGSNQWLGGFARFATRSHTAPAAPTAPKAVLNGTDATVSWTASSTAGVTHQVLRNDRVVATTTGSSVVVPGSTSSDTFFVRAADSAGNRSASTAGVAAAPAVSTTTLLPTRSTWSYLFDDAVAVQSGWQLPTSAPTGWKSGTAPFGFGGNGATTNIDVPSGTRRAVVSYYRTAFTVAPGSTFGTVTLTTRADDGVAAYVNGVEVGRSNLDPGALSGSSYAKSSPTTAAAVAAPVSFEVPVSALRTGSNTVAISTHSMWRATPDSSMDATVTATAGSNAPTTPAPPSTSTSLVAEKSAWSYLFSATAAPPATWTTAAAGTEAWSSGAAPLGWGTGPIATNIDVPAGQTRGLTSYFRRSFTVSDPAAFSRLTLTTRADDGIAVYVNGVEVARSNLPGGTLTSGTYASSAISTTNALANPVTIQVPTSVLTSGSNTIAVEVHSNYRTTPSQSMDLSLVGSS